MHKHLVAASVFLLLGLAATVTAQQSSDKLSPGGRMFTESLPVASMPRESLSEVLSVVGDKEKLRFLLDVRVPPEVVLGTLRVRDLTYPILLTVLTNNGLAAVRSGDLVSIVPASVVRQHPLPVLTEADSSIADHEWVSWVIQLQHVPAVETVPIVRPLLPSAGHLAANPTSNSILIVDRYGNVQRITKILRLLDAAAGRAPN